MKKPLRRLGLLSIWLAALCGPQVAYGGSRPVPSVSGLTVDPSPDGCFLSMESRGGMTNERWVTAFLGDGRVRFDAFRGDGSSTPFQSSIAQLTDGEFQALLLDLVQSGLLQLDPEAVLARERAAGKVRRNVSDGAGSWVTITLLRSGAAEHEVAGRVTHSFVLSGAEEIPTPEPDAPEFEAYGRLELLAAQLRSRAIPLRIPKLLELLRYSFPGDDQAVLVLRSRGPEREIDVSLTLYASGKAVLRTLSPPWTVEVVLDQPQLDRILRDVESGDLARIDAAALDRVPRRPLGRPTEAEATGRGSPVLGVQLRVEEARGAGLPPLKFTNAIEIPGPSIYALKFPSLRVYAALADLEELLQETISKALNSR